MILVTGATGIAGSEVVRALLGRGERVRAFVRDPEKARGLFGADVELALGDFADPQSFRAALRDVQQLVPLLRRRSASRGVGDERDRRRGRSGRPPDT